MGLLMGQKPQVVVGLCFAAFMCLSSGGLKTTTPVVVYVRIKLVKGCVSNKTQHYKHLK